MTWREELNNRTASFRGVPFRVEAHDIAGGRRTRLLEFPLRDKPATEDMGRKARRFRVRGYVLGEDYMDARNALLDALDAYGDGVLVHPYYGSRTVAVREWRVRETTRKGGMATFTIDFVEGGPIALPDDAKDTGWAVARAADTLTDASKAEFAMTVDTTGPERVRQSFLDKVDNALDELSDALKEACSPLYGLTDTLTRIISTKAKIEALLAYPITLADQLSSLLDTLFSFDLPNYDLLLALFTAKSAFSSSSGYASSSKSILSTVGARIDTNSQALTGLLRAALIAGAATAAAEADFATYDDALVVRAALLDALDTEVATADDAVYQTLASLRTAVVKDFAGRAASLPGLTSYTLSATLPALVVAHAIYGDADRADGIVSRNNVRHPGAVPGGVTLKVLTNG